MMRADRLLRLMLLLQAHGRVTAAELASKLEVSVRTVQRDLESLSASGIPVYSVRGSQGGWALVERFRTDLTGLTPDEAVAVAVAGPDSVVIQPAELAASIADTARSISQSYDQDTTVT
jgi:predicted DNA-binding transcriptional regulator YafY